VAGLGSKISTNGFALRQQICVACNRTLPPQLNVQPKSAACPITTRRSKRTEKPKMADIEAKKAGAVNFFNKGRSGLLTYKIPFRFTESWTRR
jgi:hypothetical protein